MGIGNLLLLLFYGTTLGLMQRGTKFPLFMTLIILLMIAAAFAIVLAYANYQVILYGYSSPNAPTNISFWVLLNVIVYCGYFVTFNIAHWRFAFEYYSIAESMPLVI